MDKLKILILDDEQVRHDTLQRRWNAHDVHHAWTVEEALRLLTTHGPFDIALLDHDLGTGSPDGVAFVRAVQSLPAPLIERAICHSHNRDGAREMALSLRDIGVNAIMEPFRP